MGQFQIFLLNIRSAIRTREGFHVEIYHQVRIDPPQRIPVLRILAGKIHADDLACCIAGNAPFGILVLPAPWSVRTEWYGWRGIAAADLARIGDGRNDCTVGQEATIG